MGRRRLAATGLTGCLKKYAQSRILKKATPQKQVSLTLAGAGHKKGDMDLQLTPEQQAKLSRIASEQGRAAETLVQEAVERFLNYDDWFSREVDKGLAAADRGEFVEHAEIRKMIDSRYPA